MIRIQNIYYMLAYAFQVLNENGYRKVAAEDFENTGELLAAILCRGVSLQLKRGLGRDYLAQTDSISSVKGKIDLSESVRTQSSMKNQLVCTYDEFSTNTYLNRILKSTMELLLRSDISKARKKELRKLLIFFADVEPLDLHSLNWDIQYNRTNQTYRMLISICYLIVKGLLQTQSDGTVKLMDFLDNQTMAHLYEKFILGYYRKHYPDLAPNAAQVPWSLDEGADEFLPVMRSDITLQKGSTVLIIDAKYYGSNTQSRYDRHTIHSGNLYQIFTYVKNQHYSFGAQPHRVSGMLLYAATDEKVQPDSVYQMHGSRISVRTLNLDQDFSKIAQTLNEIAEEHFGTVN